MGHNAGIEFLNRGGFLFWRLSTMSDITAESLVNMDADYNKITLPWLNIRKDGENFEKYDAFKDMFNYYEGLDNCINREKKKEMYRRNEVILQDNLEIRTANAVHTAKGDDNLTMPEKTFLVLADMEHVSVDPELEEFRDTLRGLLAYGSSILLGLSFANPDDNKSLIINKPIMIQDSKYRKFEKGGGTSPSTLPDIPAETGG